jgi:hypothetical protein
MTEMKDTEDTVSNFDEKLHKLIKRAKKQRGLLWPDVVSKLKLARADVRSMIKVYNSGPKGQIVPVEIGLKAKVK